VSEVFTIPAGVPFLDALARGLLARHPTADHPFALADVTVFLPTQRAARALEEVFVGLLAERGSSALLLPRLKALGEADEEELALSAAEESPEIPPAISQGHRLLRLAQCLGPLVASPEEAMGWAQSLARFLDEVLIEEKDIGEVASTVPEELAEHFAKSREFLRILAVHWPAILEEDGVIERAERRRRLLDAQSRALAAKPAGAIYVAGSTGTVPATRRMMRGVLELPRGVLILPGLDRALDERSWAAIDDSHPQAGLKQLLLALKRSRTEIVDWPYAEEAPTARARGRLLAEILRPAPTTESWAQAFAAHSLEEALCGISLLIARDRAEEARAIALAMRETLERPGISAALVTPDRALARRVAAELGRWGVTVDDSAGVPLMETREARFLRLLLTALGAELAPVPLLALLKHPLVLLAENDSAHARAVCELERSALRGPRPAQGIDILRAKDVPPAAMALIARLEAALRPLTALAGKTAQAARWVEALCAAGEACTERLWAGSASEALATLLAEIGTARGPDLTRGEFTALFEQAGRGRAVRPRARAHPRLAIWGPLEARLQSADLVILGALNEGVWPAVADIDPWANRAMRKAMGMGPPERWIGLSAHDFASLAASSRVMLTAAEKIDGSPARPSRFLMRLQNFLAGRAGNDLPATAPHGAWARQIVTVARYRPVAPPRPAPPVHMRPRKFSITEIKTLRRDPYAIFARRILELEPLDPLDAEQGAREMGTLFHAILKDFVEEFPDLLPQDAGQVLIGVAERHFAASEIAPELTLLWRRRFARAARRFLDWERAHREFARAVAVEIEGSIELPLDAAPITLRGRIDRIDADRATGALHILDYKTGAVPSEDQVLAMLDPQLALGALLALRGGLDVRAETVDRLSYLSVGGGRDEIEKRKFTDGVPALIAETERGLLALLARYDEPSMPYLSWPLRERVRDSGDYDLLARVAEWRVAGSAEE
jgi:ATP-dependent helicase/nuclease subunit B